MKISLLSALSVPKRAVRRVVTFAAALAIYVGSMAMADAQVVLPATGVDIDGMLNAAIASMGTFITIVAGVFFAYLVVRKAFKWGNKAF